VVDIQGPILRTTYNMLENQPHTNPGGTTIKTTIKGRFHEIYDMLMKCMKRIEVY
jgi:hypothetical protein